MSAVTLDTFSAKAGSKDNSVVGYPKTFHPSGAGVAEGDHAKWVAASVVTDLGCETDGVIEQSPVEWTATAIELPLVDSLLIASSSGSRTATTRMGEQLILSSSFTFTTPTLGSSKLFLCYKHQSEPYHLHSSITLHTRQLVSASIRKLGTEQALTSITNSPQAVAFVAYGGMEGDRYKWVKTVGSSNSTKETLFDLCAEWVDPSAGSATGVATGFYQEASFTFSEAASDLILCYAPGSEPFMPYPAMTMDVLAPTISTANPAHVLVGRSTIVHLIGTFGLTSGDAMKLVENADSGCEGAPAGGDNTIFYPENTTTGLTAPALGTSNIRLYVGERTEKNRPFKLCYRFGAAGVWGLFEKLVWEAYEVTGVSVDNNGGSPSSGDLLDFTFTGTGIFDGGDIDGHFL